MRDELIELVSLIPDGTKIRESTEEIFAERKSAARNEFYTAKQVELIPKYIFEVNPDDFEMCIENNGGSIQPTRIRTFGQTYNIIRTFQKSIDSMEITVG